MLEKMSDPDMATIAQPNEITVELVRQLVEKNENVQVAEVGVGIGATSLALCELIQGNGTLHLFDFQDEVEELGQDLRDRGFDCIKTYGNTKKNWDSYNWPLIKLLEENKGPVFHYAYLDGAHTVLHDAAAFAILDRLVVPGGYIDFDDYNWRFNASVMGTLQYIKDALPPEQLQEPHIKLVVDLLVKDNFLYREVLANKVYQKRQVTFG